MSQNSVNTVRRYSLSAAGDSFHAAEHEDYVSVYLGTTSRKQGSLLSLRSSLPNCQRIPGCPPAPDLTVGEAHHGPEHAVLPLQAPRRPPMKHLRSSLSRTRLQYSITYVQKRILHIFHSHLFECIFTGLMFMHILRHYSSASPS